MSTELAKHRLHPWMPTDLKGRTSFVASDVENRTANIKHAITQVRMLWQSPQTYDTLNERIRKLVDSQRHLKRPRELEDRMRRLFDGFMGYVDVSYPDQPTVKKCDYSAIELYCSDVGYQFVFGLTNQVLRLTDIEDDELLAVAAIVEYLTIDLHNFRLENIGNPIYANYQGTVYRGMSVSDDAVQSFRNLSVHRKASRRRFSTPLSFISTTEDLEMMPKFYYPDRTKEQMTWTIHIRSLEPLLLERYRAKYPDNAATSFAAIPVGRVSDHAEKEVLLRSPEFQLVRMTTVRDENKQITHHLELVMVNANQYLTANEEMGDDQRRFLRRITQLTQFDYCAQLARHFGMENDAQQYEDLVTTILLDLRNSNLADIPLSIPLGASASLPRPTWYGSSLKSSFSRYHAETRGKFHYAAREGKWEAIDYIVDKDFEWQKGDWCNFTRIYDSKPEFQSGYTLLHQAAFYGPPEYCTDEKEEAWLQMVQKWINWRPWLTLRTSDDKRETAHEIAIRNRLNKLAHMLEPKIYRPVPLDLLEALEAQTHALIHAIAGEQVKRLAFRMPQLSVLTELVEPTLWVPLPGLYGGFVLHLEGESLLATVYKTTPISAQMNESIPRFLQPAETQYRVTKEGAVVLHLPELSRL